MPEFHVTVIRVAYPPATGDADGWKILITNHGVVKGKMAWRPQDGEDLIIEAEWATWQGNRELAMKTARIDVPTDPRDMLHYVCTRTTGLGPAMEQVIWDRAGAAWQSIEEGAVPRLSGKLYQNFRLQCEALLEKSEEARVVAALMGKGCTVNMAAAAWAQWKSETLGVVNADPYRLAELDGYSFRDADGKVRRSYGIADADKRRIRAAVVYALRRITDAGDTVAAWSDLFKQTTGLLGGYADEVADCTSELFAEGVLKAFAESEGVSLKADWDAENAIWDFVSNPLGHATGPCPGMAKRGPAGGCEARAEKSS